MAKLLGIDYGSRRIGAATGDTQTRIALPLRVVASKGEPVQDAAAVAELARREGIDAFVVGLPLNMRDGSDSRQTTLTRAFAAQLAEASRLPVHLQDERLTSYAAAEVLDEAGVPAKKRRGLNDLIAAQKILQAYLDRPDSQEA